MCAEKTRHPGGDLHCWKSSGVLCESGNLETDASPVKPEDQEKSSLAPFGRVLDMVLRGHWTRSRRGQDRVGPPAASATGFTVQIMERETGFEPATLGLEGRCSSR